MSLPDEGVIGSSPTLGAASTAAGRPAATKPVDLAAERRSIAVIAVQLLLALLVVHQYQLESRSFFQVMALSSAGFVVHALLPLRYRLGFFCGLSIACIVVALGPLAGLSVLALGLVLLAICHLPIRLAGRVGLLVVVGALFALWRAEVIASPWSAVIWPILGSMFMFRIALYLHFLRFDPKRPTPAQSIAYFFMTPNVCFPLFPVIDFATFVRTYYDREPRLIYQSGIKWIARGLVHLILYRFVYLYLAGDPAELHDLGDLVQFVLATFLLYLRVSGQFHLIVGMLHLFGFRLPDTHHLYYLASGFTDFWRRINIYWKEFMTKLVYYPAYFRLRRWGNTTGLVLATAIVFLATWLLHSYQWFWLRGGFPLEPQDALFWGILAVFVIRSSLREISRPRKKATGPARWWNASLAFRTLGTFVTICVLWSLWSADSVVEWLLIWPAATRATPASLAAIVAMVVAFLAIAGHAWSGWETYDDKKSQPLYRKPLVLSGATLVLVLAVGATEAYRGPWPGIAGTVASLQQSTLNAHDASLQHKGYYENLDNSSRMSLQLWSVQEQKPAHWVGLSSTEAYRSRSDFLRGELVPGTHIEFLDKPFTVNSLGMRDRERELLKPAGTHRIAMLGPSHVMGSGVGDDETISVQLEQLLNSKRGDAGERFEVLNFGVAGTSLLYQLAIFTERAVDFRPDVVIVTDSPHARQAVVAAMLDLAQARTPLPFPELEAVMTRSGIRAVADPGVPVPFDWLRGLARAAGIPARMPWTEADRRARAEAETMMRLTLARLATDIRAAGATPVFLALDNVEPPPAEPVPLLDQASGAGFLVLDLLPLWDGKDLATLRIAPWDNHPNRLANHIIAERLVLELGRTLGGSRDGLE